MLFQGQEFAASSPFFYFADHHEELSRRIRQGRAEFLSQFPSIASPEVQSRLPDPGDIRTFERSRLDLTERHQHAEAYRLHRDLLRLRREDPVLQSQRPGGIDGAVLGSHAFVLRFFARDGEDRLLLVNLGRDLTLVPASEPLLAPPQGLRWEILWCSEAPGYGGAGTPPMAEHGPWRLIGEAAMLMHPRPAEEASYA
jgi:maltooligosyltrehalose trehalohydrolase